MDLTPLTQYTFSLSYQFLAVVTTLLEADNGLYVLIQFHSVVRFMIYSEVVTDEQSKDVNLPI
jgi:hypothetical protein